MLMSLLTSNHEKQNRRDVSKPSTPGSNSEVILILGEPTPGVLSAILRLGENSSVTRHQRRLFIFASDIPGLPQQTRHVDIHVLSERLGESSGPDSQCPNQAPGETMYLVGVLERASKFAVAWRADPEPFVRDRQPAKRDPQFSSRHNSAYSSYLSDGTHTIHSLKTNHSTHTTPAALNHINYDVRPEPHSPRDHRYAQSNSNSNKSASKELLPNLNSPAVPRSSSSIHDHQNPTNLGIRRQSHNQHPLLETYARTFDTILNFLPPDVTEKLLLKQVILLSTLCGQYFARSKHETPPLGLSSPISRTSSSRGSFPSLYSQNLKERANALFPRTPTTKTETGEARRTSTASSGSSSATGSASPARSSTPSETSRSRRWTMLSWLSTTSTSQIPDPEPGANTNVDTRTDASQGKSIELRRRLSFLFGRTPKRSESALSPSQGESAESTLKRRTKLTNVRQTSYKRALLIHILPTSWLPTSLPTESPPDTPCHVVSQRTKSQILDEPELLEKRRKSLSSPSPLSGSLDGSFTHARMQTSLMRRATLQQMRLHNLERRCSMPAAASGTTLNPTVSRGGSSTRNPSQMRKREKPPLADHLENFLGDFFNGGDVLPFVLDVGVFGREVGVNMGKGHGSKRKKILVGEAVISGLLDEFAMNRQCWVGEEDLRCLVDHIKAGYQETEFGPVEEEETVTRSELVGPKHPPPAAISPSSSEGSGGVGAAGTTASSQRSRTRARSDESSVLASKRNVIPSYGVPAIMNALKSPEPAHIYPPSRHPPAISQSVTTPTRLPIF